MVQRDVSSIAGIATWLADVKITDSVVAVFDHGVFVARLDLTEHLFHDILERGVFTVGLDEEFGHDIDVDEAMNASIAATTIYTMVEKATGKRPTISDTARMEAWIRKMAVRMVHMALCQACLRELGFEADADDIEAHIKHAARDERHHRERDSGFRDDAVFSPPVPHWSSGGTRLGE